MAGKGHESGRGAKSGSGSPEGPTGELQDRAPAQLAKYPLNRTPIYFAANHQRYERQSLIAEYEERTGASLIVFIDQVFNHSPSLVEELLGDCNSAKPLHVLLASPGGDGEVAVRLVRSMHTRCSELTMIVPDQAKSAATLMCLGADKILMGPSGDLGPVDPQMQFQNGSLVSAKEIVAAVKEAEERITGNPNTYPLYASLLADLNMLKVEQARSALARSGALVKEALSCGRNRSASEVEALATSLKAPLIDDPATHSAVMCAADISKAGLPATEADRDSDQWRLIWDLWCRYFVLGCWPRGPVAVYEGRRASQVLEPARPAS